jgi:ribosomal protein S18 acetylase RimI-like enzyme
MSAPLTWRSDLRPEDRETVFDIVRSSSFFNPAEEAVAVELVDEALAKGSARSGYYFVFMERSGLTLGYACYGPIAGTRSSFDLYWIAVRASQRGQGWGRRLHDAVEAEIRAAGGTRVYAETSSKAQYAPTRAFYLALGYREAARLDGFYAPDDGKVIYEKHLL